MDEVSLELYKRGADALNCLLYEVTMKKKKWTQCTSSIEAGYNVFYICRKRINHKGPHKAIITWDDE